MGLGQPGKSRSAEGILPEADGATGRLPSAKGAGTCGRGASSAGGRCLGSSASLLRQVTRTFWVPLLPAALCSCRAPCVAGVLLHESRSHLLETRGHDEGESSCKDRGLTPLHSPAAACPVGASGGPGLREGKKPAQGSQPMSLAQARHTPPPAMSGVGKSPPAATPGSLGPAPHNLLPPPSLVHSTHRVRRAPIPPVP